MEPLSGEKTGKKRLIGRRKSDWLIPTLMWIIAFGAILTARHFWLRAIFAEEMDATHLQQVHILEKQVESLESALAKSPGAPKPKP